MDRSEQKDTQVNVISKLHRNQHKSTVHVSTTVIQEDESEGDLCWTCFERPFIISVEIDNTVEIQRCQYCQERKSAHINEVFSNVVEMEESQIEPPPPPPPFLQPQTFSQPQTYFQTSPFSQQVPLELKRKQAQSRVQNQLHRQTTTTTYARKEPKIRKMTVWSRIAKIQEQTQQEKEDALFS